jgi:5,10-methylenetetrahydromethanopterin reductase
MAVSVDPDRKPHLGISIGVSPREPFEHTVEVVKTAEDLGFDSVWIADVHLSMKNCFIALALCARETRSIGLGTGVLNPITRHPAVLANSMSGIQELSHGRALLGIGGGYSSVYPLGLKPAAIDQLRESIRLMRALMAGESYAYGGQEVSMTVGQTGVPIYLAANQPRMLRLAGEVADGVILMGGANVEFTRWQIEQVAQGAREAGRDPSTIPLDLWFSMSVSDDAEQARDDVRPWVASQADTFHRWKDLPGFLEPYRAEFERAAKAYDRLEHVSRHAAHKQVVSDALVDLLAVAGTAEECRDHLRALDGLGLNRMTVAIVGGGRADRMRMIAEQVAPDLMVKAQPAPGRTAH